MRMLILDHRGTLKTDLLFLVRKSLLLLFEKACVAKAPTYLINNALAFLEDWQGINSICLKTSSFVLKEFLNRKKNEKSSPYLALSLSNMQVHKY